MNLMEVQDRLNKLLPRPESIQYLTAAAQGGNPQVPPFMALARISEINKEMQLAQNKPQPPAEPLNQSLPKQALQNMGIGALPQGQPAPQGMPQQGAPQGMPQQGAPQGMPPQGMQQGRPQMPQRPRDPKTAYYQYGNPPTQAKAMGGLSQVQSMRIGGGADGRSDDVNAVLSDGEYVMDAESVAMLGNGSSKAGAAKLDQMRSKLRQHKGRALAGGKISPNAKSPLSYLKGA